MLLTLAAFGERGDSRLGIAPGVRGSLQDLLGEMEGRRRRGRLRMRWLNGITDSMDMSEQPLGVGDGHGSLACCSPWGHKKLDTTERLN